MSASHPITSKFATAFASEWISAWNDHDLDRILAHYCDDFEMSSPFIINLMKEPAGMLKGKTKVREYWATALARMPDLRFELQEIFIGASSLTLRYLNQTGRKSAEVFFFDETGLVVRAAAHYSEVL